MDLPAEHPIDHQTDHGAEGPSERASDELKAALRSLPSVKQVADFVAADERGVAVPSGLVASAARSAVESARARVLDDPTRAGAATIEIIVDDALIKIGRAMRPPLAPVINATGVLLHTGLGRAPLADAAVRALAEAARSYAPVELNMETGLRGKRSDLVRGLLCELTGAESATVVNNTAAAMLLVLSSLARGKEVVVSRGELVEIGGSFRIPEVIETGGAILREVGTTNKTRPNDYTRAIGDDTAALLKVHTSNFRVEGFTDSVSIAQLAELGRTHNLPVIHDIGSGALDGERYKGLPSDEPDIRTSIKAGTDLVLFSGDKLLGGPQCGIIVGRRELVDRIERHPLMRALRVCKLTLAALGPTLQLHRDPDGAGVPIRDMTRVSPESLHQRATAIVAAFNADAGLGADERNRVKAEVVPTEAFLGGGTAPAAAIESWAIAVDIEGVSERSLLENLRMGSPAVIARINDGTVLIDLRAVRVEDDEALAQAFTKAAT